MTRALSIGLVSFTIVLGIAARAFASPPTATPEIDGATVSAGLGLLAAGVLVVRSRRRK